MLRKFALRSLIFCALMAAIQTVTATGSTFHYPQPRQGDQVDDYHGTTVADPYRWMENPDSPETRAWIESENKITFDYLKQIPVREKIRDRLTELWNFE